MRILRFDTNTSYICSGSEYDTRWLEIPMTTINQINSLYKSSKFNLLKNVWPEVRRQQQFQELKRY